MNNWKKVGLTALSASLVSVSAHAGALDVTGAASITYHSDQDSTGNPYSHGKTITFSGGGDLDNGTTVSYSYAMADAAASDSSVKIGMGDGGTLTFGGAVSGGVRSYDSMIPTAKEEAWDDLAGEANIVTAMSGTNSFVYTNNFGGFDVTAQYTKNGSSNGADHSIGASYPVGDTGLTVGYAFGEDGNTIDEDVIYAKYVIGGATLGWSKFDHEVSASATGREVTQMGISFAVNENLSVSYGRASVDFEAKTADQESSGVSASYTMGSITIAVAANKEEDTGGTAGSEDDMSEATVSFAF